MYKHTSNGNVTYFQNMPQQSTNAHTNTDTSWDLHFCIDSLIIIGKTMTQVTDTINGETLQMACRYNLHASRPK
jgi:hypothetical protein